MYVCDNIKSILLHHELCNIYLKSWFFMTWHLTNHGEEIRNPVVKSTDRISGSSSWWIYGSLSWAPHGHLPLASLVPTGPAADGGWATVTVTASKSKAFSQAATKLPQFTSMQNMDEHHMILTVYNMYVYIYMLCEYKITERGTLQSWGESIFHRIKIIQCHGPSVKICREFPQTKKRTTGHSVSLQATLLQILQIGETSLDLRGFLKISHGFPHISTTKSSTIRPFWWYWNLYWGSIIWRNSQRIGLQSASTSARAARHSCAKPQEEMAEL